MSVLDQKFRIVGAGVLDERCRVTLTKAVRAVRESLGSKVEAFRFEIAVNDAGQILLSPSVEIPAHELWLYENEEALSRVRRGLEQASRGELEDRGSFAEYAAD